ncbi:MAG: response regulator [Gammaproteobacteria bacterium]|nr:response regulator [Gammaproteobacteria bacterium]
MKMMVVDDSLVMRNKIQRGMSSRGVEIVASASNGAEAVRAFTRLRPEMVTLDITMPEMDGLECLRQLLEIEPEVRVLVISALADKATAIESIKRGAAGFLCKPFNDDELYEALQELSEIEC